MTWGKFLKGAFWYLLTFQVIVLFIWPWGLPWSFVWKESLSWAVLMIFDIILIAAIYDGGNPPLEFLKEKKIFGEKKESLNTDE